MSNSFTSIEQKTVGAFLLDCLQTMLENEKNTLIFWAEFQLDHFEEWKLPTTTQKPLFASSVPIITESRLPTTTSTQSVMELYKGFCYSQPLAYCSNCEPMCTIQTNCLIHGVCHTNILANTPKDPVYWTPLIDVCCGICNFECSITKSHPVFVGPTTSTTTTTTHPIPIPPTPVAMNPIETLSENTTLSTTESSTSTTLSTTTTTTKSSTTSARTSAETSTATSRVISIKSTLMTTTPALMIPNTSGYPENVTQPDLSITVIITTNSTLAEDVLTPDNSLLIYILPSAGVLVLGLIIFVIIYRKKLETRLNSFKSKYLTNSERPSPRVSSSEDGEVDIMDVAITDLWERIKNDDNYNSRHSQPGAFHRAPLAAVLNRDSSDL